MSVFGSPIGGPTAAVSSPTVITIGPGESRWSAMVNPPSDTTGRGCRRVAERACPPKGERQVPPHIIGTNQSAEWIKRVAAPRQQPPAFALTSKRAIRAQAVAAIKDLAAA